MVTVSDKGALIFIIAINKIQRVQTKLSFGIQVVGGDANHKGTRFGVPANRNSCRTTTIWFAPKENANTKDTKIIFWCALY
jgi:hypothetical protein